VTPELARTVLTSRAIITAAGIVLILIGALVVISLSRAVIRRAMRPRGDRQASPRADGVGAAVDDARRRTLLPLLDNLVQYTVVFVAVVMILHQIGVDATAIIASAGIVGLAVGFGAQTLIRDLIAGFFLLSEGLIRVGDEITFDGKTGIVDRISIRTTQVRARDGVLWTVPNGVLQVFGKHPKGPGA
jgi:small-conductance mechanosensitive channel